MKVPHFWRIVVHDVRVVWVARHEVLVMLLGGIKLLQRFQFGDDRLVVDLGLVELLDIGFSDLLLLLVGVEDF